MRYIRTEPFKVHWKGLTQETPMPDILPCVVSCNRIGLIKTIEDYHSLREELQEAVDNGEDSVIPHCLPNKEGEILAGFTKNNVAVYASACHKGMRW